MSNPRKPQKQGSLLPGYSVYPPLASVKAAIAANWRPERSFSTESDVATVDSEYSPILSHTGRIIGNVPIVFADEPISQPPASAPIAPPPEYSGTTKPVLLWLDGGGTKIMIESYFILDIMRRLAWDLKYADDNPKSPNYQIPPKDCFDWVAGAGCGAILVFSIACGMIANDIQMGVINIAPALREGNLETIEEILNKMIPTIPSSDAPAQTNVWLPAAQGVINNQGEIIMKGDSLRTRLLPIVMREIKKELGGTAELIDCTEPFLHAICPVFDDCAFLLSLGSGQVPPTPPPQSWWQWLRGENVPSIHPPLPPSKRLPKTNVIPLRAFTAGNETYVRFQPDVFTIDRNNNTMERLDDWTVEFNGFRSITTAYMNKAEITQKLNRAAYMLRWKDIPGPGRSNHASTSRNNDTRTRDWG